MIKKTLYFGNPVYLSLKNAQFGDKIAGGGKKQCFARRVQANVRGN